MISNKQVKNSINDDEKILKMKCKEVFIVFLLLSSNSIFGLQTIPGVKDVVELYNQALFGVVNAEVALLLGSSEGIVSANNDNTDLTKEILDLSYGETIYDNNSLTGANLKITDALSLGFNTSLNAGLTALGILDENAPYYPPNKRAHFGNMNPIDNALFDAFGGQVLDPKLVTQSNRQEFYQLRRQILTYSGKQTQKSRRLLYLTGAYLLIESSS